MDLRFELTRKRLRRVWRRLNHFHLSLDDGTELGDLDDYLFHRDRGADLFLDYYSRRGLWNALEAYGLNDELRRRGLRPELALDLADADHHALRVTDGPGGPLLIELVASLADLRASRDLGPLAAGHALPVVAIEWLLMQDPRHDFTPERPALPGQDHPGLGLGRTVLALLELSCERLGRQGLLVFPEHYHNAVLYRSRFRFLDPAREGEQEALERDLGALGLAGASWALEEGRVVDEATGAPHPWRAEEMIDPCAAPDLREALDSAAYRDRMRAVRATRSFRVT